MFQQRLYNLKRQKEVLERSLTGLRPAAEHQAVRKQEAEIRLHINAINDDIALASKQVDFHINRLMGEVPNNIGDFPVIKWT
jgi:hypothetical protein